MAKITSVQNGDSGLVARNKINTAQESVEVDGVTVSGDGNTGTELNVLSSGLDPTQIPFIPTEPNIVATAVSAAINELAYKLANNVEVINSEADLPAPTNGFIELESGKNYLMADSMTISNPIKVLHNNTIFSEGLFQITLTYNGGGNMFLVEDSAVHIRNIFVDCPNARVIKATSSSPSLSTVIFLDGIRVLSCEHIAEMSDVSSFVFNTSSILSCTSSGMKFDGDIAIISLDRIFVVYEPTDGSAVLDFQDVICPNIEQNNLVFLGDPLSYAISGEPNSGNIPSGFVATVTNSSFGNLTPLQDINVNDIRWRFADNAGLSNSHDAADAFLTATETVIINTQGVYEEVNGGNWSTSVNNRFVTGTDGVVTYIGEAPIFIKASGTITVDKVGGGSDEIEVRFAIDWTAGDSGELRSGGISRSTQPSTIPLELLSELQPNQDIRLVVANNQGTSDVDILRASLVITEV